MLGAITFIWMPAWQAKTYIGRTDHTRAGINPADNNRPGNQTSYRNTLPPLSNQTSPCAVAARSVNDVSLNPFAHDFTTHRNGRRRHAHSRRSRKLSTSRNCPSPHMNSPRHKWFSSNCVCIQCMCCYADVCSMRSPASIFGYTCAHHELNFRRRLDCKRRCVSAWRVWAKLPE